jgi:hypothetical protein
VGPHKKQTNLVCFFVGKNVTTFLRTRKAQVYFSEHRKVPSQGCENFGLTKPKLFLAESSWTHFDKKIFVTESSHTPNKKIGLSRFFYFFASLKTTRFLSFLLNFLSSIFRVTSFLFLRVYRTSPVSFATNFMSLSCDIRCI